MLLRPTLISRPLPRYGSPAVTYSCEVLALRLAIILHTRTDTTGVESNLSYLAGELTVNFVELVIVQTSSACRDLLLIQQLNKQQILGMRSLSALLPWNFLG